MMFRGVNLVMAILGFVLSMLFISYICIRLIVAQIQLAAVRRFLRMSSRDDHGSLECGLHGLEPDVIANIPTKKYRDMIFHSSDDSQCVICLSDYQKVNTLRILPYCGHYFHILCIDKWLNQHSTCPICRISLQQFSKQLRMPPMVSSPAGPALI